jgi:ATP-dependent DNA helicase RecG
MTGKKVTPEAEQRLDTMTATQDGFEIAEKDLELRGPGEFFGTKQAGMPSLRVANLIRDRELLEAAKREARVVADGPNAEVSRQELTMAVKHLQAHWNRRYGLVEVGKLSIRSWISAAIRSRSGPEPHPTTEIRLVRIRCAFQTAFKSWLG